MAMLICTAMLAGTTFAWFTDSASTGVNKIVAGNLDVSFEYWNGEKYVDAKNAVLFSEETLWEPGHTEVVYLKISNKGSLALKYRLSTINTFEYQYSKNSSGNKILLSKYLEIGVAEKNAAQGVFETRDEAVAAATDKLLDVLEGRPTTIDGVIAFAEGPAKQLMGEEVAAAMLAEQLKRKEAGAKYCNCPSCTAASELLAKFGRIEL